MFAIQKKTQLPVKQNQHYVGLTVSELKFVDD
jgi:hypothetical protein